MNALTSIFLAVIQGVTEFLPISSSGHLVLFQHMLGFREPELLLDISLHMGTLLAVCVYFRSDLGKMIAETGCYIRDLFSGRRNPGSVREKTYVILTLWVIVGTIPTVLIGLIFREPLEGLFGNLNRVGFMLVCTGLILIVTRLLPKDYNRRGRVGLFTALAVGAAQGLAIIPGISRSGTTIVCGMLCGMERSLSARYSFLLSIPAIIGAMIFQVSSNGIDGARLLPITIGFISSAIVGFISLKILMSVVRKGNLVYFAPYCWALGLLIIFL